MAAIEPLCDLVGVSYPCFSRKEISFLEVELFINICNELKEIFREQHKIYFNSMKFTREQEDSMLEIRFVSLIIKDILLSEEYTLSGIACYTGTHEDVIQEIITGTNTNPSAKLLRKIIELHRSIRKECYTNILKKLLLTIAR